MEPPLAKRYPHPHKLHGDVREDDYYWTRDRSNPDVIQYLEAENQYYNSVMEPLKGTSEKIYEQMVARVPESETEVALQHGPYFYYRRYDKTKQYPIYARKQAADRAQLPDIPEEIVLDVNELAEEGAYLHIAERRVSPDHTRLAYLENRDGSDRHTLYVKDIETGDFLPDRIPDVFIDESIEWSRSGAYIFYVTVDENERPCKLWRHRLGSRDTDQDTLIYEETDPTFVLSIATSQSGQFIFIQAASSITTEIRLLDADTPLSEPELVDARREGIEYDVEHWGDDLYVLTNEKALNGRLDRTPLDGFQDRETVISHRTDCYLQAVYPFRDALLVAGREDGLTQIWLLQDGEMTPLKWDEPLYTVAVYPGQDYDASEAVILHESFLTPESAYGLNLRNGEKSRLQVAPVRGSYESSNYRQAYVRAAAEDGASVPVTVVYRKDAFDNGPAPLILDGYGSYGMNSDPSFSPYRLPLLDAGVVFATAQVRGGSEKGRSWYEDGKWLAKRNTFTDFIAVAEHLIEAGYTTPDLVAAQGGSAGGMLAGALSNMAGDLFKVIVPEVPFVDVVTTMLDESIPLTTLEWDEWGNPQDEEYYFYMKSYSPYDNVEAKAYPHMYVTTGLNDPRVAYWEPAKWVARLRAMKTDTNTLVLKTNMGAGHFGASGRFSQLQEMAEIYAFVLDKLGVVFE